MKTKHAAILVIIAIIGVFSYFVLFDSNQKVAELTVGDVSNPNPFDGPLTKGQSIIIQLKIKNISDSVIENISVKANPTVSKNGDVIEIINNEVKYQDPIEPGIAGTLDIHVRIVNVPTETATENVNIELFVGAESQGSQTVSIPMKQ